MADIVAIPLISEVGDTYIDVASLVDGAGNHFVAIVTTGNDNFVWVHKYTPQGEDIIVGLVIPGPGGTVGYKIDKADMSHSGNDLIIDLITHDATSVKPRGIRVESARIPNVYQRTVGEELEEGGEGAFTGGSGGGSVGATKEEVQAIVDAAVLSIKGQDNITLRVVIDNIAPKVEKLFDGGNGSAIVYNQLTNTSYTGGKGANRDTIKPEYLK